MSVITITVTESTEQLLSGIPRSVEISTNSPALVFYTFNGDEPTTDSNVYTSGALQLPTESVVILKIMATDGIDSGTFEKEYQPNIVSNSRKQRAIATPITQGGVSQFPFGSRYSSPESTWEGPTNPGITVDAYGITPENQGGYDGKGGRVGQTDKAFNLENYQIIYSTTNSNGEPMQRKAGTLPANVNIIGRITPDEYSQEESSQQDRLFNPKALVVFQNFGEQNPEMPIQWNRPNFSLQNPEVINYGNLLYSAGRSSPSTTGTFVRAEYNPTDKTMNYYYRDNSVGKWIISKVPYEFKNGQLNFYSGLVFGKNGPGSKYVIPWTFWARRVLF